MNFIKSIVEFELLAGNYDFGELEEDGRANLCPFAMHE